MSLCTLSLMSGSMKSSARTSASLASCSLFSSALACEPTSYRTGGVKLWYHAGKMRLLSSLVSVPMSS